MQADLDSKVNAFTAQYDEIRDAFVQKFGDVAVHAERLAKANPQELKARATQMREMQQMQDTEAKKKKGNGGAAA